MADTAAIEIPEDLAQVAEEKGIPLDLVRRGLALGFPADAMKGQLGMPGVTAEAAEQFISEQERIRAGGEITIPEDLLEIAKAHNWPEDVIKRALKLGAPVEMIKNQIQAGITAEQASAFIAQQEMLRGEGGQVQLDLSWMKVPTEWGMRVKPGKKGLTVGMLNVGTYADIPDYWPYQTEMPRGAYPIPGIPSMGYSIYEKAELWSDNSADLYEEAIQRRWRPATDIPWDSLEPLDDVVEKAYCQVATTLCEKALVTGDVIGRWLPEMSYGYHEVKLYLSTAEFDCARQFEVFRKRAFSNGGGMGLQTPGYFHRALIDCRAWTEVSNVMLLFHNSFINGIYEILLATAHNEAEYRIASYCQQDIGRQIAYGTQHLKYFLSRKHDRRQEVNHALNKAEAVFNYEWEKDTPLREALMILLGGGSKTEQIVEGAARLDYFWRRWINAYADRLAAGGLADRREKLHPSLRKYVPGAGSCSSLTTEIKHKETPNMTQEATITKSTFPSVEWFESIARMVNDDEGYKRIGTADAEVGVKVPDLEKYYKLTFEAFEVAEIRETDETTAENTDFWLEMPYARWKDMIQNIKDNGKADLHHTLNTIDLEDPEGLARSHDGYRRDLFYRFNQTFQYFFDASARIETTFV